MKKQPVLENKYNPDSEKPEMKNGHSHKKGNHKPNSL